MSAREEVMTAIGECVARGLVPPYIRISAEQRARLIEELQLSPVVKCFAVPVPTARGVLLVEVPLRDDYNYTRENIWTILPHDRREV